MDGWVGGWKECEERTIYIDHLQLLENEQNKREKICVCVQCTMYVEKMWGGWMAIRNCGMKVDGK